MVCTVHKHVRMYARMCTYVCIYACTGALILSGHSTCPGKGVNAQRIVCIENRAAAKPAR